MSILRNALCIAATLTSVVLGGCADTATNANLPTGAAAYETIAPERAPTATAYLIVPQDILKLSVFGEPELSNDELRVDDTGFIQVPLIGQVQAAGHTATEIGTDVASRLRKSYIVDPRVNVTVKEAAKRFVSIEGEVKKPGVYEIDTNYTLLSAIARAESPTVTARLDEVIIFRTINGRRAAGRFNLKDIRGGAAPDPQILDGDVVMVGFSRTKGLYQDFFKFVPAINSFVYLAVNNGS